MYLWLLVFLRIVPGVPGVPPGLDLLEGPGFEV